MNSHRLLSILCWIRYLVHIKVTIPGCTAVRVQNGILLSVSYIKRYQCDAGCNICNLKLMYRVE